MSTDCVPFPKPSEFFAWTGEPNIATILESTERDFGVSHNTLVKYCNSLLDPEAPVVGDNSRESIENALFCFASDILSLPDKVQSSTEMQSIKVSEEGLQLLLFIYGQSTYLEHPKSYTFSIFCELFEEDTAALNEWDTTNNEHLIQLIGDSELPKKIEHDAKCFLARVDCMIYLLSAQHAEFCASLPIHVDYPNDLFIDIYKTPYKHGDLQKRFFEQLRDLTEKKNYPSLRTNAEEAGEMVSAEYANSTSKKNIYRWKKADGKISAEPESIKNIFQHSVDILRREHDVEVYCEGHRYMLNIRRMLNDLEINTSIESVNLVLDRYQQYFRTHKKRLGSWEPSSPFLEQSN